MREQQLIDWLLQGDVSIQYQVWRDLFGVKNVDLQNRIANEGWGKQILIKRNSNGHWGDRFYQPKWISTHYTLLDLRNLDLPKDNEAVKESIELVLQNGKADDGGIPLGPSTSEHSDVCVNGMFLNYASYFKTPEKDLKSIVDSILMEIMPDGGFNCRTTRSGAQHSSLHSTISVLEGLTEFLKAGYSYKNDLILKAQKSSIEFILLHQLFISDRTGEIINKDFLKMIFPSRWKYNILRALDYLHYASVEMDQRMVSALNFLNNKRNKDGSWNLQAAHPGQVHLTMEKAGKPSRCVTLKALRVLKHYNCLNL